MTNLENVTKNSTDFINYLETKCRENYLNLLRIYGEYAELVTTKENNIPKMISLNYAEVLKHEKEIKNCIQDARLEILEKYNIN